MEKLKLEFSAGQVLKSIWLNMITQKTNELVDEVNNIPQTIKDREVDISQADFDALQASGDLDPTKTYYIYE